MIDVFISFSTRGGTDPAWVVSLNKHLKSAYLNIYGRDELTIWDMSNNGPGDNFMNEIAAALKETMILLVVLDPSFKFGNNVQVLDEITKYQQERTKAGEPVLIIKVIRKRGEADAELRTIVDSNLLVSYFSSIQSNTENEFREDSPEYNNEVEKIVKEIRKHKVEQRRKMNSAKILDRLAALHDVPKIFVALGDASLTDSRLKFINELNETIKDGTEKIKEVRVLPDDFTLLKNIDHEALHELLCEDSPYRDKCIEAMLNACIAVVVPFQSNNISEAELYLKKIQFQFDIIRSKAVDLERKMPVNILQNIPQVLYQTNTFKNELDNPAYSAYNNIKLVKNQDITTFIKEYVVYLDNILSPQEFADIEEDIEESTIYIIENNKPPRLPISEEELREEESNREALWAYIADRNFTLIPRLDPEEEINFTDSIKLHKEWLKESDGIIIYRGIREDDKWIKQQQSETFKAILELKRENIKKDIIRAVYIYHKQQKRSRGLYSWCNYNVILEQPAELDEFLCKVRQH